MEVSVGSCCHDFITVMTHCRSPSGPIRARPMNLTPWQILSDPAQAQSDSPIHQDVSIASDLCLCLEILNLCSLYFFLYANKHKDVTDTHTLWFMTDRRWMATFNVFSVQITMWTRDEFRLCHQEWTSRRWVILNHVISQISFPADGSANQKPPMLPVIVLFVLQDYCSTINILLFGKHDMTFFFFALGI